MSSQGENVEGPLRDARVLGGESSIGYLRLTTRRPDAPPRRN